MNKIIVWMQSSMDGFATGPDNAFDWPQVGDELHISSLRPCETRACSYTATMCST